MLKNKFLLSILLTSVSSFYSFAEVIPEKEYISVGSYEEYAREFLNQSEWATEPSVETQNTPAPAVVPSQDMSYGRDSLEAYLKDHSEQQVPKGLSCYQTTTPCNHQDLANAQAKLDQCYLDRVIEIENEDPSLPLQIGVAHCYPLSVERDTVKAYVDLEMNPQHHPESFDSLVQPVEVNDNWMHEDYGKLFSAAMEQVASLNLEQEEKMFQLRELYYSMSHGVGAFGLLSVDAQIQYYSTAKFSASYKDKVRDEILPHYLFQKNLLQNLHDQFLVKFQNQ